MMTAWATITVLIRQMRLIKAFVVLSLFVQPGLAQQFTPQQMLEVMTKSPSNRNVRVHDGDSCTAIVMADGTVSCLADGPDESSFTHWFTRGASSNLP